MSNTWELNLCKLSWQQHVNDLSIKLERTTTLFFKKQKCTRLIEISRSIYKICYFWILLILQLSCLGSEFNHLSMDCEFRYHSLFQQWPVLEIQVCNYCLNIGQGLLNIALIMYELIIRFFYMRVGFWPVQCCCKSIKTTLNKIFPVHCSLGPWRQYCTGFSSVQYCPKSIIFWDNITQKKPYTVLSLRLQTILHKKNPVQCCLNTLWTTLHRWKPCAILSKRPPALYRNIV